MSIDMSKLNGAARLLMEVDLKPIQGAAFQPTGFPDLGAATYTGFDDDGGAVEILLVESYQSMANRLEQVCWDSGRDEIAPELDGMPYVSVDLWEGETTNTILEAHRLASPYILGGKSNKPVIIGGDSDGEKFEDVFKSEANLRDPIKIARLAKASFKYDPSSVLHGVFLAQTQGTARLRRCVSAFVEARGIEPAVSGGVKNDRVSPRPSETARSLKESGVETKGKIDASEGFGNVPYSRTRYTAKSITAYFNLDLVQIRAYGLGENAERFLIALALWKIRKLLETGLRFRTECDLVAKGELKVDGADGFEIPQAADLESEIAEMIRACAEDGAFANPPVTQVKFA